MSLPWFAFNADAYTGDTAHLTCEEHGAYLLLMLAYYRSEKPLPATDSALATIVRLPVKRWRQCRTTLAPFFVEADGVWHHERIDHEIADGYKKRQAFTERARSGGIAKSKKASGLLQAATKPANAQLDQRPLPLPIDSLSTVRLTVDKAESGDNPPEVEELPQSNPLGRAYRELVDNGIVESVPVELSPIDRNYQPPESIKLACLADADITTLHLEVQKFVLHHRGVGSLAVDWDSIFEKWWLYFLSYRKAKPKPRVEVNSTSAEEGKSVNWDWYVKRWLTNQSTWSRRAGPEPGQPGCRVPAAVFEKHGIDPATGMKAKEPTE